MTDSHAEQAFFFEWGRSRVRVGEREREEEEEEERGGGRGLLSSVKLGSISEETSFTLTSLLQHFHARG
jgi:hypothetical protein